MKVVGTIGDKNIYADFTHGPDEPVEEKAYRERYRCYLRL